MIRKGPRKKTIKDKHGSHVVFYTAIGKKVHMIGKLDHISGMTLKDSQVRSLRNWLNWYLDNK